MRHFNSYHLFTQLKRMERQVWPCAARPGVVASHVRTHLAAMAAPAPGGLTRESCGSRLGHGNFKNDSITFHNIQEPAATSITSPSNPFNTVFSTIQ